MTTAVAVIVVAIAVAITIRFGGLLSGTILGIIASIMTPTLGALFTMSVIQPIREIKSAQKTISEGQDELTTVMVKNGEKIGEIRVLVDGQMTELRDEIKALHSTNMELVLELQRMQVSRNDDRSSSVWRIMRNTLRGVKHG